jgi:hypothetical protein
MLPSLRDSDWVVGFWHTESREPLLFPVLQLPSDYFGCLFVYRSVDFPYSSIRVVKVSAASSRSDLWPTTGGTLGTVLFHLEPLLIQACGQVF